MCTVIILSLCIFLYCVYQIRIAVTLLPGRTVTRFNTAQHNIVIEHYANDAPLTPTVLLIEREDKANEIVSRHLEACWAQAAIITLLEQRLPSQAVSLYPTVYSTVCTNADCVDSVFACSDCVDSVYACSDCADSDCTVCANTNCTYTQTVQTQIVQTKYSTVCTNTVCRDISGLFSHSLAQFALTQTVQTSQLTRWYQ